MLQAIRIEKTFSLVRTPGGSKVADPVYPRQIAVFPVVVLHRLFSRCEPFYVGTKVFSLRHAQVPSQLIPPKSARQPNIL